MLLVHAVRRVGFPLAATLAAATATSALAQSSVQIFGSLDVNITHARAGDATLTALDQGGIVPSRLGFRGNEDLGGGMSASFWLESALLPDSGGIMGVMFSRRSTVSLGSRQWGELRLGRDYTPTFWNLNRFSPFGTSGVGASSNLIAGWPFGLQNGPGPGSPNPTRTTPLVRLDNSIGYFLPRDLGGFYGQAMVNFSEGANGVKYRGVRLGYAAGALDVAGAVGATRFGNGGTYRSSTIGGSYDFGAAKLYANYYVQSVPGEKAAHVMVGAGVPVGAGEFKVSMARNNESGAGVDADDATHLSVGYVHRLSKRTAVYAFASRIRNQGAAAFDATGLVPANPGGRATGLQVGVTHDF